MTSPPTRLVVYDPATRASLARLVISDGTVSLTDPEGAPDWVREAVDALSGTLLRRVTGQHRRTLRTEQHARVSVEVSPDDAAWPQAVAEHLARRARVHRHAVGVAS